MMMSEFIERTGFEPTYEEYQEIEEAYYNFDGNKDEFCTKWLADGGVMNTCRARAKKIDRLNSKILELDRSNRQDDGKQLQHIADLEKRIADLEAQLDRELEWKPSTGSGTNMDQERYEQLASAGKVLSDQEAKELIADECGFSPEKITIIHTASAYEVNKYRQLRQAAEYDRKPVYESTDWNYIRFDCASFMYELVNGELEFYCC